MAAGLGRAELEFVTSICAPLYWLIRDSSGKIRVRNGTAFFLDAGMGPFAVTAAHVLAGLEHDSSCQEVLSVQLGHDLCLDLQAQHAVIDRNDTLDIATFRISVEEITALSKTILTGIQSAWPPAPPQVGRGIYYSGFPGKETLLLSQTAISFGAAPGGGVADSVSHKDVCTQFNRDNWIDVIGHGFPPEGYDFGGMSGGPMLSVIEAPSGLRSWALAGVIYEGPSPSTQDGQRISGFELIRARRAHFILPTGRLDTTFW